MPRNPDWTRDELILALDLYLNSGRRQLGAEHPDVIGLSQTLNRLPLHASDRRGDDFRNPNGISMTLGTLLGADPSYDGAGLQRGNRLVRTVWEDFAGEPQRLREAAEAIRGMAAASGFMEVLAQPTESIEEEFPEGQLLTRLHVLRERNSSAVRRKKEKVLREVGSLTCEACDFDFAATYGEFGFGFAECHHRVPISRLTLTHPTRLSDLAIVCANCHRMIHRSRPLLTIEQLRRLISSVRHSGQDMSAATAERGMDPLNWPTAPSTDRSIVPLVNWDSP